MTSPVTAVAIRTSFAIRLVGVLVVAVFGCIAQAQQKLTAQEQAKQELAAAIQACQKEDAAFAALLNSGETWIRAMAQPDGAGNVWFRGSNIGPEGEFRRCIEARQKNTDQPVRRGFICLVDGKGRTWGVTREKNKDVLLCYDGKAWTEFPQDATKYPWTYRGEEKQLLRGGIRRGWEDSKGNLYFAVNDPMGGIDTRTPDGKWTFTPLFGPDDHFNLLKGDFHVLEQPGGRFVITRAQLGEFRGENPYVYYFDGKSWAKLNPTLCRNEYHSTSAIVPLADGSILSTCGSSVWIYWPPGAPNAPSEKTLSSLVDQFADPNPTVRNAAGMKLWAYGPGILPFAEKQLAESDDPETQQSLQKLIDILQKVAAGDHEAGAPFAGKFVAERWNVASCGPNGSVKLYVQECEDVSNKSRQQFAFIDLDPETFAWTLSRIPMRQWDEAGVAKLPINMTEDGDGALWIAGGHRVTPGTNEAVKLTPPDVFIHDINCYDKRGRIFFSAEGGAVAYNPPPKKAASPVAAQTPGEPESPASRPAAADTMIEESVTGHYIFRAADQSTGWTASPRVNTITQIGKGKPMTIPLPKVVNASIRYVAPLAEGKAMVVMRPIDMKAAVDNTGPMTLLWDGTTWRSGDEEFIFIHENAAAVAKAAGKSFGPKGGPDRHEMRIASDGGKGFWFAYEGGVFISQGPGAGTVRQVNSFEYFDGKSWHDVTATPGLETDIPMWHVQHVVDGGKSVIMFAPKMNAMVVVSFDGEKFQTKKLFDCPQRPGIFGIPWTGLAPGGEYYFLFPPFQSEPPVFYHSTAGKLMEIRGGAFPPFIDPKGRPWLYKSVPAQVYVAGKWVALPSPLDVRSFVAAPDGRIFALHSGGVVQLAVDETPDKPQVREVARWKWPRTIHAFDGAFVDFDGGIWLPNQGKSQTRYSFPPTVKPAKSP